VTRKENLNWIRHDYFMLCYRGECKENLNWIRHDYFMLCYRGECIVCSVTQEVNYITSYLLLIFTMVLLVFTIKFTIDVHYGSHGRCMGSNITRQRVVGASPQMPPTF